jgi:hypothetical protein
MFRVPVQIFITCNTDLPRDLRRETDDSREDGAFAGTDGKLNEFHPATKSVRESVLNKHHKSINHMGFSFIRLVFWK